MNICRNTQKTTATTPQTHTHSHGIRHSVPLCTTVPQLYSLSLFFPPKGQNFPSQLSCWKPGNSQIANTSSPILKPKSIATNFLKFSNTHSEPWAHQWLVRHQSSKALTHVVNFKHMSSPIDFSGTSHRSDVKQGQKWLAGPVPSTEKPLPQRLNIFMHGVPVPFCVNGYLKIMVTITRTSAISGTVGNERFCWTEEKTIIHPNWYDSRYQVLFLCFLGQRK